MVGFRQSDRVRSAFRTVTQNLMWQLRWTGVTWPGSCYRLPGEDDAGLRPGAQGEPKADLEGLQQGGWIRASGKMSMVRPWRTQQDSWPAQGLGMRLPGPCHVF